MACVPLTSNKRKFTFEATVNLDSLMAVPYVNAVFFTKMRLLNSRNCRQYSQRVSVVDNSVHWNSSHTFQCKIHIDPDTNVLESCRLKISVRMESDGGKSFHKIGYVIVDLSCFVASGFVRCRRRYLLKGYDGNRRRAGKRQDNSLLAVSFTCQQKFGSTCFRLPQEDMSNCVSTSRSFDALKSNVSPSKVEAAAATATAVPSTISSGLPSTARLLTASASPDLSYVPSTASYPALLAGGWNEDRVQMRSRRRRKDQDEAEEGAIVAASEKKTIATDESFDGRGSDDSTSHHQTDVASKTIPTTAHFMLSSSSLEDDQVSSSGGEYISPASASFEHEEECEEIFASPMPFQPPPITATSTTLFPTPVRIPPRNIESSPSSATSTSRTSSLTSPSPTSSTSNGKSPMKDLPPVLLQPSSTHPSDYSSFSIPTRISGPSIIGCENEGGNLVSGGGGQFHTCPHVRPASLLSYQQRKLLLGAGADSGFNLQGISISPGVVCSSMGGEETGTGTDFSLSAAVAAMERCSLASSGFQSHSRNSSFESGAMSRCFPSEMNPSITPTGNAADYGGSKQHLIDSTRAPHDEVVSQILRTSSVALTATQRSAASPRSSAAVGEASPYS